MTRLLAQLLIKIWSGRYGLVSKIRPIRGRADQAATSSAVRDRVCEETGVPPVSG
jgi:hypothetical protein